MRPWVRLAIGGVLLSPWTAPVLAQTITPASSVAPASAPSPASASWEVAAYGGFAGRVHAGGAPALPQAEAPITTSNPTFPSRAVSSWWFGDGTLLFNDASGDLGLPGRITPVDSLLTARSLLDRGPTGGVRVSRGLTRRLSLDLTVDVLSGASTFATSTAGAVEASRASFVSAFTGLFAAGPYAATSVTASATTAGGSSRQVVTAGSVRVTFAPRLHLVPYVTLGGGVLSSTGALPSVTLTGSYRTVAASILPINETDTVTVGFTERTTAVGVLGAGVRCAVSDRWGLEAGGRLFVGPEPLTAAVTATPIVTPGTPAGFIESFSYPSIQFSNSSATGRVSTLSGPALQGVPASSGGLTLHAVASVGLYVRF